MGGNIWPKTNKEDFRIGGKYLYCMRSPEGQDFWSTGVYREIVEPERIVCTDSFADEKGNKVSPSHYGMSGDLPAGEMSDMAQAGWNESFDKLAESL